MKKCRRDGAGRIPRNPNIQLLIKDDGGSPQGAQQGAQQALDEGAEIILGPLFAASVPSTAQVARGRSVSCIAFSTDSSVAGRGVFLLSFLPNPTSPDCRIFGSGRQKVVRRAVAGKCLRQCRGSGVQAGGRSQGRTHRRLRKIWRRPRDGGAHGGTGAGAGRRTVDRRRR